jgi:hypothetical protein
VERAADLEPQMISLPLDPQDVEVDLAEDQVELTSGSFTLTVRRVR